MPIPIRSIPPQRWLPFVLGAIALAALAAPLWVAFDPPRIVPLPHLVRRPARVVPAAELPPVEPVAFQDIAPADARAWNASVPFADGPNPPARPFHLGGVEDDRARAIDCLAAAMLYEAGDDPVGERAVGQVVINRVRHPAFPKSVCGVVFQGSERHTGCQFTFTCDGAITRAPNPASWERARALATATLTGAVFEKVGLSTHYHTDWVVPYWSASLDKVAEVHTHLFFRWTGWWGTPPAFRRVVSDAEPVIPQLAALSPAHAFEADLAAATAATATVTMPGAVPLDDGTFVFTLPAKLPADQLPAFATAACGARDYCKLLAWQDRKDTPKTLPATPAQSSAMAFSYLRDRAKSFEKPLWNCAIFKRTQPRECMKVQLLRPVPPAPAQVPPIKHADPTILLPAVNTPRPEPVATPRTPPPAKP